VILVVNSMKTAIVVCLIVSVALFLVMIAAQKFYHLDDFRFGSDLSYEAASLRDRIAAQPDKAARVVFPLVFPLDLLFLAFFAALVALCSVLGAAGAGVPASATWALLILPIAYMVTDFGENVLYSGMLIAPDRITPAWVRTTHAFTYAKFACLGAASLQALVFMCFYCFPRA
jgi:hypothetical protein